jgi:hypothetical protein
VEYGHQTFIYGNFMALVRYKASLKIIRNAGVAGLALPAQLRRGCVAWPRAVSL